MNAVLEFLVLSIDDIIFVISKACLCNQPNVL